MPSSSGQTESPAAALRLHQQERLARLFRKMPDTPDDHYLRDLLARYREVAWT